MASPATTGSYHVSGPIVIQANIGNSNANVNVGLCEDGAEVSLRAFVHEIKDDGGGGPSGNAVEFILLNVEARCRCTLVPFAGTYLNSLRAHGQATSTDGVMVTPGTLYGGNNHLRGISFASNDTDGGWAFNNCLIERMGDAKYNTKDTKPQLEFRAINYLSPVSYANINGNTLYARV